MKKNRFDLAPEEVPIVKTKHRRICTKIPVPESLTILDRIAKYESSNVKDQLPVVWDRAEGYQIFDKWGNCWIDLTSTIFVTNSGHNHQHINKAVVCQTKKLAHAYSYPTEIRANYLEKLISFCPKYLEKASLYSAGTEATERAIKLSRYYGNQFSKKRDIIIGWDGNYHGKTMGAQLAGGQHADKEWIGPVNPNMFHLPFPYPWVLKKEGISGKELFHQHLNLIKDNGISFDQISAFLLETFQGWAAVFYPVDYVQELRKWSFKNKSIMIFDEIQAGFGRTGKLFAFEHYQIEPDLVCCGKGISGGFPLSAVIGRGDLIDLDPTYTSTHGGHPVACAAGLANLEVFENENLIDKAKKAEVILLNHALRWKKRFPNRIGDIYCKGMIMGVFITKPDIPNDPNNLDIDFCDLIVEKSMKKGVFGIRTGRGTLKIGPPLNIPHDALNEALGVIEESISELLIEKNEY